MSGIYVLRAICPAGRWFDPLVKTLTDVGCSGICRAGYYCPIGSTTAYAQKCGGVDRFCPSGLVTPGLITESAINAYGINGIAATTVPVDMGGSVVPVTTGMFTSSEVRYYTAPLTVAVDLRELALPCPPLRKCLAGVLDDGVSWRCPQSYIVFYVAENANNTNFALDA